MLSCRGEQFQWAGVNAGLERALHSGGKMSFEHVKDLATIIGVLAGVASLGKALWEYSRSAVLRRAEYFAQLDSRFLNDPVFIKLTDLLETNDPAIAKAPTRDKYRYLCFFEEVALLLRADLLREELACYMFGYYAMLCHKSSSFWSDSLPIKRDYWPLFCDFAERMKVVEDSRRANEKAFVARLGA
jgi:hypothetical protein